VGGDGAAFEQQLFGEVYRANRKPEEIAVRIDVVGESGPHPKSLSRPPLCG
jgi:hypothetical protein